jgi:hypothetical protein
MTKRKPKLKTLQLSVQFTYNPELMHGEDEDSEAWFLDLVQNEELIVHSNEIGDKIGTMRVVKIF